MHDYTLASIGGFLIAMASSFHLLMKGRVTGFSGILDNIIFGDKALWRFAIIFGLFTVSSLLKIYAPHLFDSVISFNENFSLESIILGGFLVGIGTKLSNGCTSGHGVCGLPRLAIRSIISVICFLSTGVLVSTLKYNTKFLEKENTFPKFDIDSDFLLYCILVISLLLALFSVINSKISDFIVGYMTGLIFGAGLIISGMGKRSKVINFLIIKDTWDPSLMFVLGVTVVVNFFTFKIIIQRQTPILSSENFSFASGKVDSTLVIGSILFGIGWGISGLCPGPLILNTFNYLPVSILFLISIISGQGVARIIESQKKTKIA